MGVNVVRRGRRMWASAVVAGAAIVGVGGDLVLFKQCDCPAFSFSPEGTPSFITGNLVVEDGAGNAQTSPLNFACDDTLFLEATLNSANQELMSGTLSNSVYQNTATEAFYALLHITSPPEILSSGVSVLLFEVSQGSFLLRGELTTVGLGDGDVNFVATFGGNQIVRQIDRAVLKNVAFKVLVGVTPSNDAVICALNRCSARVQAPTVIPSAPLDLKLFRSTSGTLGIQIHSLEVVQNNGFQSVVDAASAQTFFNALTAQAPAEIPLPKPVGDNIIVVTEDEKEDFDLAGFINFPVGVSVEDLDFSVSFPPNGGSAENKGNGLFTYISPKDETNDIIFDFGVALLDDTSCKVPGQATVQFVAVNDPPEAQNANLNVFAGVDASSNSRTLKVGTDVDNINIKLELVNPPGQGELFASPICDGTPAEEGDEFDVTDGNLIFCYRPPNVEGETDFSFILKDDDIETSDEATATIIIENSLTRPDSEPSLTGNEDTPLRFTFTGEDIDFGTNQNGAEKDFNVLIVSAPDPDYGDLLVGDTVLRKDSVVVGSQEVIFRPAKDFFNLNTANERFGEHEDGLGNPIVEDCSNTVEDCPIVFRYKLTKNGATSVTLSAFIFLAGDDDGQPVITANEFISVDDGKATSLSKFGATIKSDEGKEIFPIELEITGADGVEFTIDPDVDSELISDSTIANMIEIADNKDCDGSFCNNIIIEGLPGILTELLATLEVKAVKDSDKDPRLVLKAKGLNDDTETTATVRPQFRDNSNGFFDDTKNIYIVGGAGGGALLLLAVLTVLRLRNGSKVDDEKLLDVAERAVEIELRGRKNKEKSAKELPSEKGAKVGSKKSIKIDVDDGIFDWEKHIDKESGEVYFFNPKTGESQWDPPTVRNYS